MGKNHEITNFGVITIKEVHPANLRTIEISSSGFKAGVAEEQSADKELVHISKSKNFLASDSSSGSLDGSEYSATSSQLIF